jgi:hypothetical protein
MLRRPIETAKISMLQMKYRRIRGVFIPGSLFFDFSMIDVV